MTDLIEDGLTFSGYLQPPTVPPDPVGDDWRGEIGPAGPAGPTGAMGPAGSTGAASVQASLVTANGTSVTLPAGAVIIAIILTENAAHAVNVQLGTTVAGTEVMSPVALGASQLLAITPLSLSTIAFAGSTPVYISSASWGGASVSVRIWYVA